MTKVTMYWPRLRLEVSGHAGADEIGKDIVCAGESILVYALAQTLENAENRGRCEYKAKIDGPEALIWANPTMGSLNEIKAYFRFAVNGLKMLAEQYPGNVSVKEVN